MRKFFLLFILAFHFNAFHTYAQNAGENPKLVVGLVIDQMRWDYLYRFGANYGNDGFKRLLNNGYSFENTFIPYLPTYTAVGHTSVYTGSVPAIHGIMGNNWYERSMGKKVYCTDDSTVSTVGSGTRQGKMSPANLWVTTVSDELRLGTNFKSKVIGVSLKDRGSILPAGHSANAAYWYDDKEGKWITSSYYMQNLPGWVKKINDADEVAAYMSKSWNLLLDKQKYLQSNNDANDFEGTYSGQKNNSFPYDLNAIEAKDKYSAFKTTPFAATYTFNFAMQAIEHEQLGQNTVPDFLAVSISSTDYIGHRNGPNSLEIEDAYIRLDRDIADFLSYLDTHIGKGKYLFFLTADHAVNHIPAYLNAHKLPGAVFDNKTFVHTINDSIEAVFGIKKIIVNSDNYQLYLDRDAIKKSGQDVSKVKYKVMDIVRQFPFVVDVFEMAQLAQTTLPEPIHSRLINAYNPVRSGDIYYTIKPGYFSGSAKGTTHGMWNPYDSHIPLLWFGWKIKAGATHREVYMTDIAPTVAALLKIQMPSGCVGKVLGEIAP